ncbi:MAG: DUF3987 domain-containing protein [Planctomycetia bacterium]|nr:DUF3987 domain-containing protein [Planctomycetia bacterium]
MKIGLDDYLCKHSGKDFPPFGTVYTIEEIELMIKGKKVTEVTEVTVSPEEIIQVCEFPLDVLSDELKKLVSKISTSIDISHEAVASIALTVLSACVGNTVRVSPKKDFYIAPFLWTAVVLPPGAGKSPTQELLVKPVKKMQSQAYLKYKKLMQEYEVKLNAFKKDKSNTTEQPEVPQMDQFYISDSTVEAMADVFESQPRGILNSQDELSGLILGLNQYKAQGNDKQHYLDLFNCNSWKIDRKGKSRFIPNTGMGIIGGIQPMVLIQVFGDDSFHDGFIQRFIFVCPESRPLRFSRENVSDEELTYWEDLLYWCFEITLEMNDSGFVKSKILTLSDGALNLWETFYNEYGQLATILPMKVSGFIPKLYLYSLKLAGLLHIIESFKKKNISPTINEKTIQDAINLTKYFFGQINKVLRLYSKKDELKEYQTRLSRVIHTLQGDVASGKLPLSKIVEGYNKELPTHAHLTSEKISNILSEELGLTTKKSTGNYSCLLWEDEKIKNLFRATVTTVTIPPEIKQGGVNEVTEVTDDFKENNESAFWNEQEIQEVEFMEEVETNV